LHLYLANTQIKEFLWAAEAIQPPPDHPLHCLISYHYFRNPEAMEKVVRFTQDYNVQIFADSGAFSAYKLGSQITLQEYSAWLQEYRSIFHVYANFDVIGDAVGTDRNQRILEDSGLNPLPVFHAGSSWDVLEGLIERYPYIALGGLAAKIVQGEGSMRFLVKCYRMGEGRAVFHGFGATGWKWLSNFGWYSCDSSAWVNGFRFGVIHLFDKNKGKMIRVSLGKHAKIYALADQLRLIGYDPRLIANRDLNTREVNTQINAITFYRIERYLSEFFGVNNIPQRQES
jgi:hypothetical protein